MEYKAAPGVIFEFVDVTLNGCTIRFTTGDPQIEPVEIGGIAEPFDGQGFIADDIRRLPKFDVYRLNPAEAKILAEYGWIEAIAPAPAPQEER